MPIPFQDTYTQTYARAHTHKYKYTHTYMHNHNSLYHGFKYRPILIYLGNIIPDFEVPYTILIL